MLKIVTLYNVLYDICYNDLQLIATLYFVTARSVAIRSSASHVYCSGYKCHVIQK